MSLFPISILNRNSIDSEQGDEEIPTVTIQQSRTTKTKVDVKVQKVHYMDGETKDVVTHRADTRHYNPPIFERDEWMIEDEGSIRTYHKYTAPRDNERTMRNRGILNLEREVDAEISTANVREFETLTTNTERFEVTDEWVETIPITEVTAEDVPNILQVNGEEVER